MKRPSGGEPGPSKKQKPAPPTKVLNSFHVPSTCEDQQSRLAKKNKHPRDFAIAFDPKPHVYYVKGQTGYVSVTTLAHKYFKKFEPLKVATKMVRRSDFKTAARYRRYQKIRPGVGLPGRIVELWKRHGDTQAALGTNMHRYIELHNNGQPSEDLIRLEDCIERQHYHAYDNMKRKGGFQPYRTEWMLWDEDLKIAGSVDMIYYNPVTKTYHMVDWKRSKEIKRFGFGFGFGVCSHLPDCNYSHYSLQLNIYKYLLEKNYGMVIEDMHIVVFHPINDSFLEIKIPNLQALIPLIVAKSE